MVDCAQRLLHVNAICVYTNVSAKVKVKVNKKSVLLALPSADPQEGLGWYLLGRCYMAAHKHELAYAAYEQAV